MYTLITIWHVLDTCQFHKFNYVSNKFSQRILTSYKVNEKKKNKILIWHLRWWCSFCTKYKHFCCKFVSFQFVNGSTEIFIGCNYFICECDSPWWLERERKKRRKSILWKIFNCFPLIKNTYIYADDNIVQF